jgi:hypothetical protein
MGEPYHTQRCLAVHYNGQMIQLPMWKDLTKDCRVHSSLVLSSMFEGELDGSRKLGSGGLDRYPVAESDNSLVVVDSVPAR